MPSPALIYQYLHTLTLYDALPSFHATRRNAPVDDGQAVPWGSGGARQGAGEWTRGAGPDVSRPAGVEMTSPFSQTYADARAKFLSLASERGATVVSAVHPTERGAEGEDLAIDIATFGDPDAEKTLFLVSGPHGQAGFVGSALQMAFIRELAIGRAACREKVCQ